MSQQTALLKIPAESVDSLLVPVFDAKALKAASLIARGLPAGPGAATGRIAFTAAAAEQEIKRGNKVVLCRTETSPDDLKGLKMRIPGLGGDVMAKLGASPVSLPGGQIYENLIAGSIDATEWVGPWNDGFMKFYEAAKYYYYPGMHEPGSMLSVGINKKWWDGLSKSDQMIIEAAASMENDVMMAEFNARNGEALNKLVTEQGVQLREFNDDVYDAFGEAAAEVYEETRKHSDLAARIHDSFASARQEIGSWMKISDQAYLNKRNQVLDL
jgi:TRAP-type mannitol/chloroaromatic compound transport system substrate-binding protein